MHWTNLDHMASLFTLQDAVATTTRHTSDVEKLRTVNHVIVLTSRDAHPVRLNLEA